MKTQRMIMFATLILFVLSCGQAPDHYAAEYEMMESPAFESETVSEGKTEVSAMDYISSSAAMGSDKDSTRKFIKTTELKFKVKNVIKSTYDIEGITVNHNGFVILSNLTNKVDYVNSTIISADSTLETTYYTMVNSMIVRVPQAKLDTVLKDISRNIDFLDYRIIKANDVALQILSNRLAQRRSQRAEQRMTNAIDNRGAKLKDAISAEESVQMKQEQSDNAMLTNLTLADQIDYSTISIQIYQRQSIKRETISNNKNIDEFKPHFGKKLIDAARIGWDILETIILFLVNIWGLFLIALIVFFAVKWYRKCMEKKNKE